jgi:LPS sulfotransferase NodH
LIGRRFALARTVFSNAVYIYLDRLDAHAQALSLYRAKVSNRWHMKLNETFLAEDIPVNADELAKCAAALDRDKKAWLRFFFDEEITPLSIAYEHMCDDMPKAVRMICAHVGVDVAQTDVPAGDFHQISRSAPEQRVV